MMRTISKSYDVIVVGGGQAGLAVAYYLTRAGINYLVLDKEDASGGSWQHYWDSLKLFSPAQWSSLPGKLSPGEVDSYPGKADMVLYLKDYEAYYGLKVERPVDVSHVTHENGKFSLETSKGIFSSKVLISTTGSFNNPTIPHVTGLENFKGKVIHSSDYRAPSEFSGLKVAVVGEGNSGAQVLAEVSKVATTYWLTQNDPDFLPDYVDGHYLFNAATQLFEAKKKGRKYIPPSLGHIVMVPSVRDARDRGVLTSYPSIQSITDEGLILQDGSNIPVDVIIFCTGYKPAITYLAGLNISFRHHKVNTHGTRSRELPGLWMVGYGSWTGFASDTVIGVGRSAKSTVEEVTTFLKSV